MTRKKKFKTATDEFLADLDGNVRRIWNSVRNLHGKPPASALKSQEGLATYLEQLSAKSFGLGTLVREQDIFNKFFRLESTKTKEEIIEKEKVRAKPILQRKWQGKSVASLKKKIPKDYKVKRIIVNNEYQTEIRDDKGQIFTTFDWKGKKPTTKAKRFHKALKKKVFGKPILSVKKIIPKGFNVKRISVRGKYFTYIRNTKTGHLITRYKWKRK